MAHRKASHIRASSGIRARDPSVRVVQDRAAQNMLYTEIPHVLLRWSRRHKANKVVSVLFNWTPRHGSVLGSGGIAPRVLNLGTWWEWSASRPGHFTPSERAPGTHWIGGWVGSGNGLDTVVKRKIPSPWCDSNPRTPRKRPLLTKHHALKTYEEWRYSSTHS
jgi:hypothetical protein